MLESRLFIKIWKTAIVEFKRRFLPRWLLKSHSQALHGHGNQSRSDWEQEIQEIWCIKSLIKSNCPQMLYIVEEHLNIYANLRITVDSSLINDSDETHWIRIVTIKSWPLDHRWTAEMMPRRVHYKNASNARCWIAIRMFQMHFRLF